MKTARHIGDIGEDIAEKYLKKHGWKIITRNFSVRGGEIDLIAYRFGVLAYVEVKTRSGDMFGRPRDAVDIEKITNINYAKSLFSETYIRGRKINVFYPFGIEIPRKVKKQRIDVIEIYLRKSHEVQKINHIKDWK
jgi:putative endonuclease